MEITFIIALHHIKITENLCKGDKINDTTYISNDNTLVPKLIPHYAIEQIGLLEYNGLLNAEVFIYSCEDLPTNTTPENYLVDKLFWIQSFMSAIWVKLDNNVDIELGFVFYKKDGVAGVSSNHLAISYSNANAETEITILNRSELREIRAVHREKFWHIENAHLHRKETQLLKQHSRIEMALYHIQIARTEIDLGLKIANYCSALEALFSTSQAELAHQLSERLAYFISNSPDERLKNYKLSKQAYAIRSKVVHGTYVKDNNLSTIKAIASFCDSSLRLIMFKLVLNKELSQHFRNGNEALDEYMLNLIFGIHK